MKEKYYLFILGCAMNYSDAERLGAVMEELGYERTYEEAEADLIFTIACSVRQHAIDRIYGKLKKWERQKKTKPQLKLILSGCVLPEDKKKMEKVFDFIFEIKDLQKLKEFLSPALKANESELITERDYLSVTPKYESNFRAYVPISTGCNNFCTYCAVPYTRGREKSRPKEEIINEVKDLVRNGYKEIILLGQNVNSYGQDLSEGAQKDNSRFIELLQEIDAVAGEYRVYFYSNHPKDMTEELIGALADLEHFPHYIHFPLQSGSDEIIRRMNRHYTKDQYLKLVAKIREQLPDVALTTDIIVGFPGETEKDFTETIEVMKKAKFDLAFTAQYSPRSGTPSAKMKDDVSKTEKVRREKELIKILSETSLEHNQKLVGGAVRVLIDGEKAGDLFGRTDSYKIVQIKKPAKGSIGQFSRVKIIEAEPWKLIGELL